MKAFKDYLYSKQVVTEKQIPYYISWVSQFFAFLEKDTDAEVLSSEIDGFLKHLASSCEEWQVQQAQRAIQIYLYFRKKKPSAKNKMSDDMWKTAVEQMVKMLRLKHRSLSTEKSYLGWLRSFCKFLDGKFPGELEGSDVKDFLTHLAIDRRVAKATQNQAFNALLFFFRHVLEKDIEDLSGTVRAKTRQRIPVVLSVQEIFRLFEQLRGTHLLMAKIVYGGGLRLGEVIKLRIKDVDFERSCLTIRAGKGDKDRQTVLPESIMDDLQEHLEQVRDIYEKDRKDDIEGVYLPGALEKKHPNAGKEWAWQWLFPSRSLSVDPRAKVGGILAII